MADRLKQVIRACEAAGLVYSRKNGNHARLTHPTTGRFVSVSVSPSDAYAYRQVLRDVKRYLGIEVTP